ncbi:hypothetical protein CTI16_12180 [Prevotella intermedia]|uniref:Uncharacterized protein n=1 Tax=Prevotella intermedia TaxID=28131 RepID=A0AAJ3RH15_PREIN|nr:hypothetical protein CTI16_12180 [Prevotella intermedia]
MKTKHFLIALIAIFTIVITLKVSKPNTINTSILHIEQIETPKIKQTYCIERKIGNRIIKDTIVYTEDGRNYKLMK